MTEVTYSFAGGGLYTAFKDDLYVGRARVDDSKNLITVIHTEPRHRRQGVARGLIEFIVGHRGKKLTRNPAPNKTVDFGSRYLDLFEV